MNKNWSASRVFEESRLFGKFYLKLKFQQNETNQFEI